MNWPSRPPPPACIQSLWAAHRRPQCGKRANRLVGQMVQQQWFMSVLREVGAALARVGGTQAGSSAPTSQERFAKGPMASDCQWRSQCDRRAAQSQPAIESRLSRCTRLIRLLDELVNPRLEHLAELLVVGIAEGAAGAGGTGRLRGGVRVWAGELGRLRGGRRTASSRGAFSAHRGASAAAALARRRLLTNAAGARGLLGAGLGFSLRLSALVRRGGARFLLVALRARPSGRLGLGGLVPSPVAAPQATIVARAPAGFGLERGLRLLEDREEEERLRGAGTAHRRGEGSRKDGRSTVGRAHAHAEAP